MTPRGRLSDPDWDTQVLRDPIKEICLTSAPNLQDGAHTDLTPVESLTVTYLTGMHVDIAPCNASDSKQQWVMSEDGTIRQGSKKGACLTATRQSGSEHGGADRYMMGNDAYLTSVLQVLINI